MSTSRVSWRPALRIAGRDAARHKLATGLAGLLVALPVVAAVVVSTVQTNTGWYSENATYARIGAADAQLKVTAHEAVTVRHDDRGTYLRVRPANGDQEPRRDPASVGLPALLPDGSRLLPDPNASWHQVRLDDTGGKVAVTTVALDDPLTRGLGELLAGEAPTDPDEVAVAPVMAEALGLLDGDGQLQPNATIQADGESLQVVGLAETGDTYHITMIVPPGSLLASERDARNWLVDLPELTTGQLTDLRDDLAAQGVAALFRDAVQHPEHWPELERQVTASDQVDAEALAIGAVVVGFGVIEVVLLVGAALAVGARRQIRTLGLLASNGGSPRDVRRVVLARGLLIGSGASVIGAVFALGGMWLLVPWRNDGLNVSLHVLEVSWLNVAVIVLLGAMSGLIAAAYPGWLVGRLAVVDALAGRFPTGHRPSRLRLGAVGLIGAGAMGVILAGWWIAVEYRPNGYSSGVPVLVGGLALLLLLGGVIWATPYLVDRGGAISGWLGLAGRLAVRDATRHRQRTAAAVVGLLVTIAGSVFAGFGLDAAVSSDAIRPYTPPGTAAVFAPVSGGRASSLQKLQETAERAIGADALVELRAAVASVDGRQRNLELRGRGTVMVVGEDLLTMVGIDETAIADYRSGSALVTRPGGVDEGQVRLVASAQGEAVLTRQVSAVPVATSWRSDIFTGAVWISPETAEQLGARAGRSTLLLHKPGGFDADDAETLRALGINSDGTTMSSGYQVGLLTVAIIGGAVLVTVLAIGVVVSLAAAEGRDDAATLAAVGAPPGRRRVMGAVHGLFVGVLGGGLGLVVGTAAGASLLQVVGTPGVPVPWLTLVVIVVSVPLLAAGVGWMVTPSRVDMVRRIA